MSNSRRLCPEPEVVNVFTQESIPRNRIRHAKNRFLGSLEGLQIRALLWIRAIGTVQYGIREQRWYFKKLESTGSLFLGIDPSGGIDSDMELIPCWNRLLLYKIF